MSDTSNNQPCYRTPGMKGASLARGTKGGKWVRHVANSGLIKLCHLRNALKSIQLFTLYALLFSIEDRSQRKLKDHRGVAGRITLVRSTTH